MPRALVTGATAGVGRALARAFAARGYELTLVARTLDGSPVGEDLESARAELADHADVTVIQADLTVADDLMRVAEAVVSDRPDVVVNNAGIGLAEPLRTSTWDAERGVLALNVVATTMLTKTALEYMIPAGHGRIMNVSSVAGTGPAWLGTTYGATKGYIARFTQDIGYSQEVVRSRAKLMALVLGHTVSSFHERAGIPPSPSLLTLDANVVARKAVTKLLSPRPPVIYVPSVRYKVLNSLLRHAPGRLPALVGAADDFTAPAARRPAPAADLP